MNYYYHNKKRIKELVMPVGVAPITCIINIVVRVKTL